MKLYSLLSKSTFLACALFAFTACSKTDNPATTDGGSDDGNISLTTSVAYSGDVPEPADADPVPQVRDAYAPFVGVWKENYGDKTYVFLPDGRVAYEKLQNGETEARVGMYFPNNTENFFDFVWMTELPETHLMTVDGDVLSLTPSDYNRVGDAEAAETAYNTIYNALKQEAEANAAKFPVGPVTNTTPDPHDPNPTKVIKGANVVQTGVHFQDSYMSTGYWYDLPDGRVEGFDGYSRTDVWLMPNGRFFMQLWLWDGVNPQNRMESFTHQASWGKYTVIKGSDALKGDIVNFYYDHGGTAAYRTKGGQAIFRTKNIVYHQK